MPKYRNITDDTLFVPHLGISVAPDQVVEVPADKDRDWPESVWASVPVSKRSTNQSED